MTLADLLFLVSFFVVAIFLIRIVYLLLRRRFPAARFAATWLSCFVLIYGIALVAVSLLTPQKVLAIGQEQCFDEWCISITGVSRQPSIQGTSYIVTTRVSSKSRGRRQRESDVYTYLTDSRGRRFEESPSGQRGTPLTSFVDPGGSFESQSSYDVPKDAANLAFVKTSHSWFPVLFIIGDPSSFLHRPTIVSLETAPK